MSDRPHRSAALLAATLVLTALNLRAAVTSVGALLRDMQFALGMSDTLAGLLTALPVVAFGVFGLLTARMTRKVGPTTGLVVALVLITVGLAVRAIAPTVGWLLVTTMLSLVGIAVGNVLVPVMVKAWFPNHVGRVTGWYSMALLLGTALPATVSVPLADLLGGWRWGLGFWALPAGLALLPWLLIFRGSGRVSAPTVDMTSEVVRDRHRAQALAARAIGRLVRGNPKTWALAVLFGLQSLEAYVAMGWLSAIFQDAGIAASRAGLLLGITMVIGAPIALIVPGLAARHPDQRPWIAGMVACSVVGYLGLLLSPGRLSLLWAVLLGVGLGAFPLALLLIGLRAVTGPGTSALSSSVQGVGYLIAVAGPLGVGVLRDVTGSWDVPLAVLLALLVPKLGAGLIAGKPGYVDQDVVR
ncbi:MAG: MFS transporter [Nitriliruptoraceae bacterium]